MEEDLAIAWTVWNPLKPCELFYVAQVPGQGGKDWGYETDVTKAILLTPYWQRRFRKDCERTNKEAYFMPADEARRRMIVTATLMRD